MFAKITRFKMRSGACHSILSGEFPIECLLSREWWYLEIQPTQNMCLSMKTQSNLKATLTAEKNFLALIFSLRRKHQEAEHLLLYRNQTSQTYFKTPPSTSRTTKFTKAKRKVIGKSPTTSMISTVKPRWWQNNHQFRQEWLGAWRRW